MVAIARFKYKYSLTPIFVNDDGWDICKHSNASIYHFIN